MAFIQLTNVDLVYGAPNSQKSAETLAVSSANLSVEHGEFLAIVGPSGCGKSTLLKLIAGLVRPNRGSVTVDGKEVTQPLKTVGMAFQNATLCLGATFATMCCCRWRSSSPIAAATGSIAKRTASMLRYCSTKSGSAASAIECRGNCPAACSSARSFAGP